MSQIFRSFEANNWAIERKVSEDLAKSSTAIAVDQSNLGQAPRKNSESDILRESVEV